MQLGAGGPTGSIVGNVSNNGTLAFNRSDGYLFGGLISGGGGVNQLGTGTTILTANNTYTGGTTITSGTLQLGNGGTSGGLQGDVVNNGVLVVARSDQVMLNDVISGSGAVVQNGSGQTVLTGKNTYSGVTVAMAGSLFVNGDQSAATGGTFATGGSTLGGTGIIGGNTFVAGTLSPGDLTGAPGTLTITGDLTLDNAATLAYNFGQAGTVGGPLNDPVSYTHLRAHET